MSEVLEGAACGVEGCTPAALDHFRPASSAKATLAIEVISDAICPWCWIAKRRLDRALAALALSVTASVHLASLRAQPGDAEGRRGPACLPFGQVRDLAALPGARRAGSRGKAVGRARVQP